MNHVILGNGKWTLELSANGHIVSLTDGRRSLATPSMEMCELRWGSPEHLTSVAPARLLHTTPSSAEFETAVNAGAPLTLRFTYSVEGPDGRGTALTCRVGLHSDKPLTTDILLRWRWNVRLRPGGERNIFVPLFDGRGLHSRLTRERSWHFIGAGQWGN